MKKRILALLLVFCMCICPILSACDTKKDDDDDKDTTKSTTASTQDGSGVDGTTDSSDSTDNSSGTTDSTNGNTDSTNGATDESNGTTDSTGGATNDDPRLAVYESYVAFMSDKDETPLSYEEWLETVKGTDGITPHIGENGNWYIGSLDTGVPATGDKGDTGNGIEKIELIGGELIVYYTDGTWQNLGKVSVADKYTVSFDTGCDLIIPQQVVDCSSKVTRPSDPVRAGYTFEGWYCQGELWSFIGYCVTEDIVLEAKWSTNSYTATFVANGTVVGTREFTLDDDAVDEPSVPSMVGYTAKWESYELVARDITVNAQYTPIVYEATFVDGTTVIGRVNFTVEDDTLEEPALPTREGFTGKWSDYTIIAEDFVVYVVWTSIFIDPPVNDDWSGKTLNVLATTWNNETPSAPWSQVELTVGDDDWYSDEGFGQIINRSVLERAEFIKNTYGVEINWINARGNQIANKLAEAVVGGSQDTRYHIAMPRMMEVQSIVATNSIYKVSNQDYIDLSKSYYNQASIEAYSAWGNTLFAAGDFSFLDEQTSYMIYYNVALTKGFDSFPDLYQLVKEGKWTVDVLINTAKLLSRNMGEAAWTDDDIYGYGTTNMSRFYQYSGIQQVTVLDGEFAITLDSPKISTLITKINTITSSAWARTDWTGGYGALQQAFEEGRLLFYDEVAKNIEYFTYQSDDFKVGVLPTPKLTEDQYSYLTPCSYMSVVMCIPKATSDREMSNYFFEVLSYTGQKYIMKAYYDNLRTKLDPETADQSMEIIQNYIHSNIVYDQGYMYGWDGLLNDVQVESYSSWKNNFRQVYEEALEDATNTVDDWNLNWLDYTDTVD